MKHQSANTSFHPRPRFFSHRDEKRPVKYVVVHKLRAVSSEGRDERMGVEGGVSFGPIQSILEGGKQSRKQLAAKQCKVKGRPGGEGTE